MRERYSSWQNFIDDLNSYEREFKSMTEVKRRQIESDYRKIDSYFYQQLSTTSCDKLEGIVDEVFSISPEESPPDILKQVFDNYFYRYGTMRTLACLINDLFMSRPLNVVSEFWIKNIKKIGDKSSYGDVYTGEVGGYSQMVVFKINKHQDYTGIIHECVVGLKLNRMRSYKLTNFVYTFSVAKCHYKFCQENQQLLMQEFVKGPTVGSLITSNSLDELTYLSIVLQLILALRLAYIKSRFQHLDLHSSNVLAREYKKVSLPFSTAEGPVYVWSPVIATIIDFGLSTIRFRQDGQSYQSNYSVRPHTYSPNLSPLADIFRFVGDSYASNITSRVTQVCQAILSYFVEDPVILDDDQANKLLENYFILPNRSLDNSRAKPVQHLLAYDGLLDYISSHEYLKPLYDRIVKKTRHPNPPSPYDDRVNPISVSTSQSPTSAIDYLVRLYEGWPIVIKSRDLKIIVDELTKLMATHQSVRDLVQAILQLDSNDVRQLERLLPNKVIYE
jgi:hypothetical protein